MLNGANGYTGGTNLNAGQITVGTGTALGTGALAMADLTILQAGAANLTLANNIGLTGSDTVDTNGFDLTLTAPGSISGAGSLTKIGAGILTLNGANSYTLGTNLNAGQITVGTNSALGTGALAMAGGTTLQAGAAALTLTNNIGLTGSDTVDTQGFVFTLAAPGSITGGGSLTKIGSGTLVLNGANGYTGGTALNAGTIQVGSNTALGTNTLSMANATTLQAGASVTLANSVALTGTDTIDTQGFTLTLGAPGSVSSAAAATLVKTGAGTLVLGGANSYSGNTNLTAGAIRATNGLSLGTSILNTSGGTTLISGAPVLMLGNAIVLGGPTTIDLTGTSAVINPITGTLTGNGSALTLAGNITGSGPLQTLNSGTLTLAGTNSFTGGVIAQTANILVTNVNSLGTGALTLNGAAGLRNNSGGALTLGNEIDLSGADDSIGGSSNLTLTGGIFGGSGFNKVGTNLVTIAANAGFEGAVNVNQGNLRVDAVLGGGGAVNVAGGAALSGVGTIAGTVTIADGGILAPGDAVGTLTVGSLILSNNSLLNFDLGVANVIGGAFNDRVVVNGALTLDGLLNVSNSNAFGVGIYNLISYSGALTDMGLSVNSLPASFSGAVQTLVPGQVNLIVAGAGAQIQYWDGSDFAGNNAIDGGNGVWNSGNTNWTFGPPNGALNANWQGGVAIFSGTAGTVDVQGTEAVQGLQFLTDGYTLNASGGGTLNLAGASFVATGAGIAATINAPINGAGTLSKQGAGTLTLGGTNALSGGIGLDAGVLAVTSSGALGTGTLSFNTAGTILRAAAGGLSFTNTIALTAAGTVDTQANTLTLGGIVSGASGLTKQGSGTLVLTAANSYAGGTTVSAGTLEVRNSGALGGGGLALTDTTTLRSGAGGLSLANLISLTGGTTVDTNGLGLALTGVISGGGVLTKTGAGDLLLTGANSYGGGTVVNAGSVSIGNSSALGGSAAQFNTGTTLRAAADGLALGNFIGLSGTTTIDTQANTLTLSNVVSGTEATLLTKTGSGTLVLNAANTYGGNTALTAGTIVVGNGLALSGGQLTMSGGTTLRAGTTTTLANAIDLNGVDTVDTANFGLVLNGAITGPGSLTKTGSGVLTLGGGNSYGGGTNLTAGTLVVASNTALGAASGALAMSGGTTLQAAGNVSLANAVGLTGSDTVDSNGFAFGLTGIVSGGGTLVKAGAGTLTLSNANGYSGGTNLTAGTLAVGNNTALGTAALTFTGGTTLQAATGGLSVGNAMTLNGSDTVDTQGFALTLGGVLSGTGSLVKTGTGTLTLTSANLYTGGTSLSQGILAVTNSGALGFGALGIANGTTLQAGAAGLSLGNAIALTGTDNIDTNGFSLALTGAITGGGILSKTGAGTLSLTAANGYSGGTIINAGTVSVGNTLALGTGTLSFVGANATLLAGAAGLVLANDVQLNGPSNIVDTNGFGLGLTGTVLGTGPLLKTGAGDLRLTAANGYSGGTVVSAGSVSVGNSTALGSSAVQLASGTTLRAVADGLSLGNSIALSGATTIDTAGQQAGADQHRLGQRSDAADQGGQRHARPQRREHLRRNDGADSGDDRSRQRAGAEQRPAADEHGHDTARGRHDDACQCGRPDRQRYCRYAGFRAGPQRYRHGDG